MKLRLLYAMLAVCCFLLMTSCGSNNSTGNSGEYVSSSWNNNAVAHLLIKPTGEVSGYLLVMPSYLFEMTGSVSDSGNLSLSIKDPSTQQPLPETTTTGVCDGRGTCTGTAYDGPNQPYKYTLVRVSPHVNKFAGIYKAPMTLPDASTVGTCWFGIDSNGKICGFSYGIPTLNADYVISDVSTIGDFSLTNSQSDSDEVTISGNLDTNGAINNGMWHTLMLSGSLAGAKLLLN